MEINDEYLVKKNIYIDKGEVPIGGVIVIKKINKKIKSITISIYPFIIKNNRDTKEIDVNEDFINKYSTKINK